MKESGEGVDLKGKDWSCMDCRYHLCESDVKQDQQQCMDQTHRPIRTTLFPFYTCTARAAYMHRGHEDHVKLVITVAHLHGGINLPSASPGHMSH